MTTTRYPCPRPRISDQADDSRGYARDIGITVAARGIIRGFVRARSAAAIYSAGEYARVRRIEILSALVATALIGTADAQSAQPQDIFAPQAALAPPGSDGRLLRDALFGRPGAADKLRDRLSAAERPDPAFAVKAWAALCMISDRVGDFRQAVADCAASHAVDPAHGGEDTRIVMRRLAHASAPSAQGAALTAIDADGNISVVAGSYTGPALVDTGATLAVMMQSVARTADVRVLGSSRNVTTSTAPVSGQVGIIPRIAIAGATVENLPVLVLPDAQLTFDGGKVRIPFLLSLAALRAFGRVAWLDHGTMFALGDRAPALSPGAVPVFWHPLGIGLPLDGPNGRFAAHFDTGSNATFLFESGLALVSDSERAALLQSTRRVGGVGGVVREDIKRLPTATLSLAGQPFVLTNTVVAATPANGEAARIGEDMLKRYGTAVLDFRAMEFSLTP